MAASIAAADRHTKKPHLFFTIIFCSCLGGCSAGCGAITNTVRQPKEGDRDHKKTIIIKKDNIEESKLPPHVGGEAVPDTQRK